MFRNRTDIQNCIRQLPVDERFPYVTYILAGFYYQNFVTFFVPDSVTPTFRYPNLLDARIPLVDVRDTGKVIHELFCDPMKRGDGQTVSIVSEQLTMAEICATIRNVTRRDIDFIPLSHDEALLRLHRETVHHLRWYHDVGSRDEQQAERTRAIYPKMNTFIEWIRENQWMME